MKLVSIALATYNGEEFLESQLESLVEQDYPNLEIVICDDCSTDNTIKIIKNFINYFPDKIKLLVNNKNLGFVYNFEKAISLCNGDYIALSDQDDIWYPHKISRLVDSIGDKLLITSNMNIVNRFGDSDRSGLNKYLINYCLLGENRTRRSIWTDSFGVGCSMMFTSRLKNIALPFPRPTAWHDMWIAALAYNEKSIGYLDEKLFSHRLYNSSSSTFLDKDRIGENDLYKIADRILFNEILYLLPNIDRDDKYYIESNSRLFIELYFKYANLKNDYLDIARPAEYLYKNSKYFQLLLLEYAEKCLIEILIEKINNILVNLENDSARKEILKNDKRWIQIKNIIEKKLNEIIYDESVKIYFMKRYLINFNYDDLKPLEKQCLKNDLKYSVLFTAIINILPIIKASI